jgi:hypothetical protein
MQSQTLTLNIQIPELADFVDRFPQYGPFARGNGHFMFNLIMSPLSFLRCQVATELNLPAVAGVAEISVNATSKQHVVAFDGFLKQFIGALVCSLMEANGFLKSGKKKSVPHPAYTKGEFYQKAEVTLQRTEFCPLCRTTQNVNGTTTTSSETNSEGETKSILTVSYHCEACHAFIRSEDFESRD